MKKLQIFLAITLLFFSITSIQAQEINPGEIKQVMKKVADWQIEHYNEI